MDFDNFGFESSNQNNYAHFSQSRDYNIVDLLFSEKNSQFEENIYDSDQQFHSKNLSLDNSKYQQTQNQVFVNQCIVQINQGNRKTEKLSPLVKKTKPIQKKQLKPLKKRQTKSKEQKLKNGEISKGNKSKYNNMGSFLIGSVSQILNNLGGYRFINNHYDIKIEEKWTVFSKLEIFDNERSYLDTMRRIKRQIEHLPRKQGAKKDLFKLINTHPKDAELRKDCKKLIRQELLYSLNNEQWLRQHAYSRDFKPIDDKDGLKKKERHQAYLTYLNAIKDALRNKGQLPKRLNL